MADANVKAAGADILNRWSGQPLDAMRIPYARMVLRRWDESVLEEFDAALAAATTENARAAALQAAAEVMIRLNT